MAGFAKITTVGNYLGSKIVNVFWYRSELWNPLAGNPFAAMAELLDAWWGECSDQWFQATMIESVMQKLEGVGYTDTLSEVPGSFNTKTILAPGVLGGPADSSALTANISWRCGAQHQITGVGSSRRNRGSTAIGPIPSDRLSDDGHFLGDYIDTRINALATILATTILDVGALASIVPIRIHHARTLGVPSGITYSDILGYGLPSVASYRRSRRPEA